MAVVKEMKVCGATVRIHDDCYRGIGAEEMQRRRDALNRVISQIWYNRALRELEKQEHAKA